MEKLLLFGINDSDYCLIERIASRLQMPCERISPLYYHCRLEDIVSGKYKTLPASDTKISPVLTSKRLLVMCHLSDKRMDKLLFELRHAQISLDYKAVLTPSNSSWTIPKLLLEMHTEKEAYANNGAKPLS